MHPRTYSVPVRFFLGAYVPWQMRPLDDASLGPVSLGRTSLGRRVLWTMRPLDDAYLRRCVIYLKCFDLGPHVEATAIIAENWVT